MRGDFFWIFQNPRRIGASGLHSGIPLTGDFGVLFSWRLHAMPSFCQDNSPVFPAPVIPGKIGKSNGNGLLGKGGVIFRFLSGIQWDFEKWIPG
ncbi:MAG: hypothetical protein GY765_35580 [bacterium]|nr:hypothetical protein [bacterium]